MKKKKKKKQDNTAVLLFHLGYEDDDDDGGRRRREKDTEGIFYFRSVTKIYLSLHFDKKKKKVKRRY